MEAVWTSLAFVAFRALAVSAATYGYTIYYEKGSTNCVNSAVTVRSWVSGEPYDTFGANSSEQLCSAESLCILNAQSEQCKSLDPGVFVTGFISVLPNGTKICRNETACVVPARCSGSVPFPDCSFSTVSQETLLADPSLMQNTQFPASAINQTSYLVYYSDDQCSEVAGVHGLVTGNNSAVNFTTTTNASGVSCSVAMACLFNSAGASCQAIGSTGTSEGTNFVNADGSEVTACADGVCNVRLPSHCQSSVNYAGCYVRRLSGKVLFENPSLYLAPPARPTSSALQNTDRILGAGLAVLQCLLLLAR